MNDFEYALCRDKRVGCNLHVNVASIAVLKAA